MKKTLLALGSILVLGLFAHCKGDFDPAARIYACKGNSECATGFDCRLNPASGKGKVCVPSGQTPDFDALADTMQVQPDGQTLTDVGCTSDVDCIQGAGCLVGQCIAGVCAQLSNAPDGSTCDDGVACTESDTCTNGVCSGVQMAVATVCKDDDPCTINTRCTDDGQCLGDPKCTTALDCVKATCEEGVCGTEPLEDDQEDSGWCLIGGVCYLGGELDPQNPCMACRPIESKTAFSAKGDGEDCDAQNQCAEKGACLTQDGVTFCDYVGLKDGDSCFSQADDCKMEGTCKGALCDTSESDIVPDGTGCDDGDLCTSTSECVAGQCVGESLGCPQEAELPCTTKVCGENGCEFTVNAGFCVCEGVCVTDGELNPNNPCQFCDTSEQTTAWTSVSDGADCGGGTCTGKCKQGKCSQSAGEQCVTEDGCFEIGSDHPKYPCHRCELVDDPTTGTGSSAAWMAKPVGTVCDASYPIAATGLCVADPVKSPKDCIFDHSVKVAIGQGGWMGCPQCLPASMDQEPRHFVSIKPFEIDAAEVSANLFLTCIQAGGCVYEASSPLKGELDECALVEVAVAQETQWKVKEAYLPMNCVTRKEAIAFCEWNGKVLCSEAQWERAAVGSCANAGIPENFCEMSQNTLDVPVYPWGMKWNFQAPMQPCEPEKANWFECEANQVLPILDATGLRYEKAMHYDVYGLSGNVAEWVRDTYHASYMGAPDDGSPWVDGDSGFEDGITRGGGYQDMFPFTTTIYRDPKPVSWRNPNVGFRCCSK